MQWERTLEELPNCITFITPTPGLEEEVLIAFNRRSTNPYDRVSSVTDDLEVNTHLEDVCCRLIDGLAEVGRRRSQTTVNKERDWGK